MSDIYITEYRGAGQAVEPGGISTKLPLGAQLKRLDLNEYTKVVRVASEEPCLIGFGTSDRDDIQATMYLPADRPETFPVLKGTTIVVRGEF